LRLWFGGTTAWAKVTIGLEKKAAMRAIGVHGVREFLMKPAFLPADSVFSETAIFDF
jgi:hypothetical protein